MSKNKIFQIKAVTTIMGEKGIVKALHLIIAQKVLIEYNLEGLHNKKRLRNFPKLMDVLFCKYK